MDELAYPRGCVMKGKGVTGDCIRQSRVAIDNTGTGRNMLRGIVSSMRHDGNQDADHFPLRDFPSPLKTNIGFKQVFKYNQS